MTNLMNCNMKNKILVIVISTAMLAISLFPFQPKSAKTNWCDHCYRTVTGWPGICCNCFCQVWNYEGKDLCDPKEPQ